VTKRLERFGPPQGGPQGKCQDGTHQLT